MRVFTLLVILLSFHCLGLSVAQADNTPASTKINNFINSNPVTTDLNANQNTLGNGSASINTNSGTNTSTGVDVSNITNAANALSNANQSNAQQNYQKSSNAASTDTMLISTAAIAVGAVMVAEDISYGYYLIAAGIAGEGVAIVMSNNANTAGQYNGNLNGFGGSLNGGAPSGTALGGTNTGSRITGPSGTISIDPSLLSNGKMGPLLSNFEAKTGIPASDLVNAVQSGASIPDLLANAPKGTGGTSGDALKSGIENAMSEGAKLSRDDILAKTGLSAEDLKGIGELATSEGGARALASKGNSASDFFGSSGEGKAGEISGTKDSDSKGKAGKMSAVSSDVQAALDKNGISNRSIFEIVHRQYVKQLPIMKGIERKDEKYNNPLEEKLGASPKGM